MGYWGISKGKDFQAIVNKPGLKYIQGGVSGEKLS